MTQKNLEIIVTNGYCCSALKAVTLSKLLSLGNICTDKQEFELLILNNALIALTKHDFTIENNCLTEEELDKLTHTVMNICNICDCQLKQ